MLLNGSDSQPRITRFCECCWGFEHVLGQSTRLLEQCLKARHDVLV
jgi:UTP:GlnB (protein PII) uridylyltransferase